MRQSLIIRKCVDHKTGVKFDQKNEKKKTDQALAIRGLDYHSLGLKS